MKMTQVFEKKKKNPNFPFSFQNKSNGWFKLTGGLAGGYRVPLEYGGDH